MFTNLANELGPHFVGTYWKFNGFNEQLIEFGQIATRKTMQNLVKFPCC